MKADLRATLPAATVAAAPAPQLLVRAHVQEMQATGTPHVGHTRRMSVVEATMEMAGTTHRVTLAVAGASGLGTVTMVAVMATVVRTVLVGTTADPGTVPVEPPGRGKTLPSTRISVISRKIRSRELTRHRRIRPQVLLHPKAGRRRNQSGTTSTWRHTSTAGYMGHSATYISSGL